MERARPQRSGFTLIEYRVEDASKLRGDLLDLRRRHMVFVLFAPVVQLLQQRGNLLVDLQDGIAHIILGNPLGQTVLMIALADSFLLQGPAGWLTAFDVVKRPLK